MFVFLSKLLAPALSPIGIVCELLAVAIVTVRRRPRISRSTAVAALLVLLVCSNQWFSTALTRYLETRNPPNANPPHAEAIVVLSSDAEPAIPPQPAIVLDGQTANRLLYGAQLYREGRAPVVILSGGQMPWLKGQAPMSQPMTEVIELMGVPESSVIQEPDSANTYENAKDVKAILNARHIHRILLVTSAMHMPRALALFRHQGIDAIAAPCEYLSFIPSHRTSAGGWQAAAIHLIPEAGNLQLTSMAIKELLGMAVYRAAGRL
jgi:uncharacterized SAM-binding protein YcdF (DUF218 family)